MSKKMFFGTLVSSLLFASISFGAIDITIETQKGVKKISPYLYGKNIDGVSDTDPAVSAEEKAAINKMLDAGIHFLRTNTGNNSTRYNWRKKLTVHPDWFSNVYAHDWDIVAKKVQQEMPGINAMFALQLAGYAASSKDYNFPDWDYYQTNGSYPPVNLNLNGGAELGADGKSVSKKGDYSLYNEPWPADSTVGIISYWKDELNYDMKRFQYWSMDNEMDIWMGTHDDLPLSTSPDFLVERYIDVAKKARAAWKDIKLTGPVVANEWQWCSVSTPEGISGLGKGPDRDYCWLEYFIMKIAEEQKKSGIRLLDVFDIHWYPSEKDFTSRTNWHRVLFDKNYNYPGANGVKLINGSWDESNTKPYIFARVNEWLDKYFGKDHGITLGITETSLIDSDPMVTALIYASFLGTMSDNGVEIFTPWSWGDGMYEVVHLFSRYAQSNRVLSQSTNDSLVSAYSSINNKGDSLTVILVNRTENNSQEVNVNIPEFSATNGNAQMFTLSEIKGETFVSHTQNALKKGTVSIENDKLSLTLPAKSIVAVQISSTQPKVVDGIKPIKTSSFEANHINVEGKQIQFTSKNKAYALSNVMGQVLTRGIANGLVNLTVSQSGIYILRIGNSNYKVNVK